VVTPGEALGAVLGSWNVLLFFVGLMVASAAAERAGVFVVAADWVARLAGGSARRLLVLVFALGTLVTALLSNDATALLLTPVVFSLARRLDVPPLPYAFACALVANAASFILPVSNPANLLVLEGAPMGLDQFVGRLWLPSLASVVATLSVLLALNWGGLGRRYVPPKRPDVTGRVRAGLIGLGAMTAGYLTADLVGVPLGVVACLGAALLVGLDQAVTGGTSPGVVALARDVGWGLLGLLAGLTVVVAGLQASGAAATGAGLLRTLGEAGPLGLMGVVLGSALLSNVVNNLPMALVAAAALHELPPSETRLDLAAALIVGIDLGPNLTTVGSFATMLWLMLLRRRGVAVSAWSYGRVGLVVTPPALLAATAALLWTRAG
jgi:arsenical pump membrane protein